jgi:hypothetical protein
MNINEEILRIKDVMGLINESYLNKDKIANSLNQLKWWLYSYEGLGFQKLIDDKLSKMELKSPLRPDEIQKYTNGAQILKDLGVSKIKLLSNNPKKRVALDGYGLEIIENIDIAD